MRILCRIAILFLIIVFFYPNYVNASVKNVSIQAYNIRSVVPLSFRSCEITLSLLIHNNYCSFSMEDIQGVIYKKDIPMFDVIVEDMYLSRGATTVNANAKIISRKGLSICSLIYSLLARDFNEFSADIHLLSISHENGRIEIDRHLAWQNCFRDIPIKLDDYLIP